MVIFLSNYTHHATTIFGPHHQLMKFGVHKHSLIFPFSTRNRNAIVAHPFSLGCRRMEHGFNACLKTCGPCLFPDILKGYGDVWKAGNHKTQENLCCGPETDLRQFVTYICRRFVDLYVVVKANSGSSKGTWSLVSWEGKVIHCNTDNAPTMNKADTPIFLDIGMLSPKMTR
jgi:hypothetical protein